MNPIRLTDLYHCKAIQKSFTCVTVYDASFARLLANAQIEIALVGDTLGQIIQGHPTTLPTTMESMIYHTECVARTNHFSLLLGDLPFMSYANTEQALQNAAHLMRAGAHMIKMEGGAWLAETVKAFTERGIPVCAHIGLQPQSYFVQGGYRVQGREPSAAEKLIQTALCLEQAGAKMMVLECIPSALAKTITERLRIPVMGIGAGIHCDGQILVLHDLLGVSDYMPRFAKNFLKETSGDILKALQNFREDVHEKRFPTEEHSYA